jgi:hypothetical protein
MPTAGETFADKKLIASIALLSHAELCKVELVSSDLSIAILSGSKNLKERPTGKNNVNTALTIT